MALVHHWPLTETTGTTAYDVVGTNHCTMVNYPLPVTGSPIGGALRFNGAEGRAEGTYLYSNGQVGSTLSSFAFSIRFKTSEARGTKMFSVQSQRTLDISDHDLELFIGTNGRLYFGVGFNDSQLYSLERVNNDVWHHALVQYDGSLYSLWLDGTKVAEAAFTRAFAYANWYWLIGGYLTRYNFTTENTSKVIEMWHGELCDARVYDAPLSPAEIAALAAGSTATYLTPHASVPQSVMVGKGMCNWVNCKLVGVLLNNAIGMRYATGYSTYILARYPLDVNTRYVSMYTVGGDELSGAWMWGNPGFEVGAEGWSRPSNFIWADNCYENASWLYGQDWEDRMFINKSVREVILEQDVSNNATTHGVSQYPAGYAPVPTHNVINVSPGTGTLAAAVAAASHNDNLVLAPGTYYEDDFGEFDGLTIDKAIRIYGATEDPDDVIITRSPSFDYATRYNQAFICFKPYRMLNCPENYRGPGLFHVTVRKHSSEPAGYATIVASRATPYEIDWETWSPPPDIFGPALPGKPICSANQSSICEIPSTSSRCTPTSSVRLVPGR